MTERNYVRVYYNDLIADYPEIWEDDAALAGFIRLLATAEAMWPMLPEWPRRLKASRKLVDSGLLVALPRQRFTIKGLDAERSARSNAGRNAAASRWRNAKSMPNRAEPNRAESPLPHAVGKRANGTNPRALGTNARAQGTSPRQEREGQKRGPTRLHDVLEAIRTDESEDPA